MIRRHSRKSIERELAALADGTLTGRHREAVKRRVAASPELQARLDEQLRAVALLRGLREQGAPAALRSGLAARQPAGRARSRRALTIGPALAAPIAVLAVVLAIGGAAGGAPTVAQAATIAMRSPVAAVSEPASGSETLPGVTAGGLPFPSWERSFGWRATGARSDRLEGRTVTTVYYRRGHETIAYSIVSGAALTPGAPARQALAGESPVISTLTVADRAIVTWTRGGHSCVLSGSPAALTELVRLAAWHHGGERRY